LAQPDDAPTPNVDRGQEVEARRKAMVAELHAAMITL
jgi:hypothetical protein